MSYFHELGYLAIASRLKNFTDSLVRDVSRIYRDQDIEFEPRWFTTFYLLATKGELSVMEVAKHLNQSHPSVNQVANALEKSGLLISSKKDHDGRKRFLKLSGKGEHLFDQLQPLWKNIEQAANSFFSEVDPGFLETLQNLENGLQKETMFGRIKDSIRRSEYEKIEIIDFIPELKEHFAGLNTEWLEKYFKVEEEDRKILFHPEQEILQKGGKIFFAKFENRVVGTVAVLKRNEKTCELTKMAVTGEFQGKKIGSRLLETSIDYARKNKYKTMVLCTSPVLKKAINLYKSHGFTQSKINSSFGTQLTRGCKQMELKL